MIKFTPATPKKYTAKVKDINFLTWKNIEVTLCDFESAGFSFIPGQFINLEVAQNTYRSYSIVSDYKNPQELTIVVSAGHKGIGADFLKNLKPGQKVNFIGPSGKFLFKSEENPAVMIGTGTGITPTISMLYQLEDLKFDKGVQVLFGIRHEKEVFYLDKLKEFERTIPGFSYLICVSQPENPQNLEKNKNFVSGRVTQHLPQGVSADYYICGHSGVIQDITNAISPQETGNNQVYSEKFSGIIVRC